MIAVVRTGLLEAMLTYSVSYNEVTRNFTQEFFSTLAEKSASNIVVLIFIFLTQGATQNRPLGKTKKSGSKFDLQQDSNTVLYRVSIDSIKKMVLR